MSEPSVMVVEDEHTLRTLLRHRLGQKFAVRTAENGRIALDEIREDPPDLIVSDVMMPEMDGFKLKETLQSNDRTRTIPFIFLTVKSEDKDRERGLSEGADDYITKPFEIERLVARIDRLLERRDRHHGKLTEEIGETFSRRLLPGELPDVEGYRLSLHRTAQNGGSGHLYDWMELPKGRYLFSMGTVTGDQVPTRFYQYGFLSYIRSMVRTAEEDCYSPARTLEKVNDWFMEEDTLEGLTASLLLVQWNPTSHRIFYANAGHCPLVGFGPKGKIFAQETAPLGKEPKARYHTTDLTIPSGHALAAFNCDLLKTDADGSDPLNQARLLEAGSRAVGTDNPPTAFLNQLLNLTEKEAIGHDALLFWLERR